VTFRAWSQPLWVSGIGQERRSECRSSEPVDLGQDGHRSTCGVSRPGSLVKSHARIGGRTRRRAPRSRSTTCRQDRGQAGPAAPARVRRRGRVRRRRGQAELGRDQARGEKTKGRTRRVSVAPDGLFRLVARAREAGLDPRTALRAACAPLPRPGARLGVVTIMPNACSLIRVSCFMRLQLVISALHWCR